MERTVGNQKRIRVLLFPAYLQGMERELGPDGLRAALGVPSLPTRNGKRSLWLACRFRLLAVPSLPTRNGKLQGPRRRSLSRSRSQPTYKEWKGASLVFSTIAWGVPSLPTRNGKRVFSRMLPQFLTQAFPAYLQGMESALKKFFGVFGIEVPSLPTRNGKLTGSLITLTLLPVPSLPTRNGKYAEWLREFLGVDGSQPTYKEWKESKRRT